jgi:hypothetical protein
MAGRSIRITTPAGTGATYVPIDRFPVKAVVQAIAVGTVTFTVDYTNDQIIRGLTNPYDKSEDIVTAANANWTNLIASASASGAFRGDLQAYALRVNITAGTGSVLLIVNQSDDE